MKLPVACTLTDTEQVERQKILQEEVRPGILEAVPLERGYALRFPGEGQWVRRLARLIELERECCPFLTLELVAEAGRGSVWLRAHGPEGTRAFLEGAFRLCGVDTG